MRLLVAMATLCAALSPAIAQDVKAGRQIALMCQGCHGLDGLSKQPDAPNLAMQPEIYLVRSLTAYRTGERKHEQMKVAAEGLSDRDIANVSAYYAAIEIEVISKP
ncbi:MAG: c-type cytochrome [Beijerinckiaceae bacterium]